MNIQELLNKGFSAKFIEEHFDMLTGATTPKEKPKEKPKEQPKETPKEQPKEQPKEATFTESEVKEIIKKYASMENKKAEKVENKPLSKDDIINNILGITVETALTPKQDIDTQFENFMSDLLGYEKEEN